MENEIVGTLTERHGQAIAAMLAGVGPEAICEKLGISAKTLDRWAARPEFAYELRRQRERIISESFIELAVLCKTALGVLAQNMAHPLPSIRYSAAKEVLRIAGTHVESLRLQRRIEELEKVLETRFGRIA